MKGAEDYIIKMAEKAQENLQAENKIKSSEEFKYQFWTALLKEMSSKSELFKNISPRTKNWISAGSGLSAVVYSFAFSKDNTHAEFYIDTGNKDENKKIFDFIYKNNGSIENAFGYDLVWDRLDNNKASRIYSAIEQSGYEKENWSTLIPEITDHMSKMEVVFKNWLKKYKV